jgi:transcriptional regulator with XRE-family HTH domain
MARENSRLSQEEVAEALGLPRTAIAKMEAGRRGVSSLELAELARLFSRPVAWFVEETPDAEEDVLVALLRLAPEIEADDDVRRELNHYLRLCQEGCDLRRLLGMNLDCIAPAYSVGAPSRTDEAVNQGERVAQEERNRLGIGDAPITDMADLIVSQGIWASGVNLPEGVSGLFLRHSSIGLVILVNVSEQRERKRFSYAHEYAHSLMDRDGPVTVSRFANRHDLSEVRANAFAAAFLMPAEGVREFIRSAGKGKPSRERHVMFGLFADEAEPQTAERRHSAREQRITYMDVVLASRHFRVNYDPMVFRLRNLGLISQDEMNALREKKDIANDLRRAFGRLDGDDGRPDRNLEAEVLELAIEAYRREEISAAKLRELAELFDWLEGGPDAVLDFAEAAVDE